MDDLSKTPEKKIVILGAGITGLTLAKELSEKYKRNIVVLEKENFVGGLASTFSMGDVSFDLGSHRLHRDSCRHVIKYIQEVMGEKLLNRQRNGSLYFRGDFMKYPLNIFNFIKFFSSKEILGFAASYLQNIFCLSCAKEMNYENAMIGAVGKNVYEAFYKDYAKKLWGRDPQEISIDGKKRRIILDFKTLSKSIFGKNNYFFYPRGGIGSIAKKLGENILSNNVEIIKGIKIRDISLNNNGISTLTVEDSQKLCRDIEVFILISTIPIDDLFCLVFNEDGDDLKLEWRGIKLLNILIDEIIKHESETYYFPGLDIVFGRVSDIRKYSPYLNTSVKGTSLTIEIPVSAGDNIWTMDESILLDLCLNDLVKVNVLHKRPRVLKYFFANLGKVYPVYTLGWKDKFTTIHKKLNGIDNLFTIGRNGLYLHCNIDHCIDQGLILADHILSDKWSNKGRWDTKATKFLSLSARD